MRILSTDQRRSHGAQQINRGAQKLRAKCYVLGLRGLVGEVAGKLDSRAAEKRKAGQFEHRTRTQRSGARNRNREAFERKY